MTRFALTIGILMLAASLAYADEPNSCILLYETVHPIASCSNNTDIRAQRISPDGALVWNHGLGVDLAASPDYDRGAAAVSDGAGGAIVAYELKYNGGAREGDVDICAQRLSPGGKLVWNDGAPAVVASTKYRERDPVIVSDGAGGAIIGFLVDVPGEKGATLTGVCAQRISATGEVQWLKGKRSVVLADADGRCSDLVAASDGAGGAFFAFRRLPAAGNVTSEPPALILQRVTAAGEVAWASAEPGGLRLGQSAKDPRNPQVIADGAQGVWAIYEQGAQGQATVLAQLFDGAGQPRLGAKPVLVAGQGSGGREVESGAKAVADGKGGVICVFATRSPGGVKNLGGARLADTGKFDWGGAFAQNLLNFVGATCEEYALLAGPNHAVTIALTAPVEGRGSDGHLGLGAQRLNNLGEPQWGKMPVEVSNPAEGSITAPTVLSDGRGGLYVAYVVKFAKSRWRGDTSIFCLRLGPDGKRLWKDPLGLAATTHQEYAPVLVEGP